ncbi:MAG: SET domain-containing protein-lysine N-methyltransferase [Chthoniobacterales bacterium]|nr:SET domain-containing protein-lysine N-methyltransferase [Chthoniobacterales bacterium]
MKSGRGKAKALSPQVIVRPSGIHGRGVFARQAIRKGKRIIEYTGAEIPWDVAQDLPPLDPDDPHHTFFFSLDNGNVINAAVGGNEARWINHSCAPNCRTDEHNGRVFVYALRNLQAGEELSYDYRLQPAERQTKKLEALFGCECGSARCRGTMLEARPKKRKSA